MTDLDTITALVSAEVSTWEGDLAMQMYELTWTGGEPALERLERSVATLAPYASSGRDGICVLHDDAGVTHCIRISNTGLSIDRDEPEQDGYRWYPRTVESRSIPLSASLREQIQEVLDTYPDWDGYDDDDDWDDDD